MNEDLDTVDDLRDEAEEIAGVLEDLLESGASVNRAKVRRALRSARFAAAKLDWMVACMEAEEHGEIDHCPRAKLNATWRRAVRHFDAANRIAHAAAARARLEGWQPRSARF